MSNEIVDMLEELYRESERTVNMLYERGDYSPEGREHWRLAVKLRDKAYKTYMQALLAPFCEGK